MSDFSDLEKQTNKNNICSPIQTGRWRFSVGWAASCGWRKEPAAPAGWSHRWQLPSPPPPPAAGNRPLQASQPHPGWLALNLGGLHDKERVTEPMIRKLQLEYCNIWSRLSRLRKAPHSQQLPSTESAVKTLTCAGAPIIFLWREQWCLRKWQCFLWHGTLLKFVSQFSGYAHCVRMLASVCAVLMK